MTVEPQKESSLQKDSGVSNDKSLLARKDPGFWRDMWHQARLVYRLILDPEVPVYLKVLPFVTVVYLLLPFDLLPDVAPVLGQLDDLTLLLVGSKLFIELAPPQVVGRHLQAIREQDGYTAVSADALSSLEDQIIIDGQVVSQDSEPQ